MEMIHKELATLNDWKLDLSEPHKISREFKFKNFAEALSFVNKAAEIAESMNHHPDIVLKWGYVQITYWTHNANGLTEMDFEAGRQVEKI